jgi:hypothetical protein
MELEDLKITWQKYDSKLDNLEKLNKKLILNALSKKPQNKLNWMKYRSFFSLFLIPVVLILALNDNFRIENIDLKFIVGCLLTVTFVFVMCYLNFKGFMVLKGVDLSNDSIIESARKVTEFKRLFVTKRKFNLMAFPLVFAGILLISWKSFDFDSNTILILTGVFFFSLAFGYKELKMYRAHIDGLEKDIHDLNEYAE